MKAKEMKVMLSKTIAAKIPILITGAPGIGKTEIVQSACDDAGAEMLPIFAAMSDPTEPKGLPSKVGDVAEFLPYGFLRKLHDAKSLLVCFLDDFGQASPSVQASFMQLLGARVDGNGKKISDHVVFIAATNRREDKAGVSGLLEPVKSRFSSIINLEVDDVAWVEWALNEGVPIELIAFIKFNPRMLHQFKPSNDMVNTPSPRTVYRLGTLFDLGLPSELEFDAYKGAVGEGFATEFMAFIRIFRKLPNPDSILINPDAVAIPDDMSVLYALSGALARKTSQTNIDRVLSYINRMPAEFQVLYIRETERHCPDAINTRAYIQWQSDNAELLI